jgi:hypothetical protein
MISDLLVNLSIEIDKIIIVRRLLQADDSIGQFVGYRVLE